LRTTLAAVFAVVVAGGARAQPVDIEEPAETFLSTTRVTLGGRLGVSAGNVLAVPYIVPGPGATVGLSQRFALYELMFVAVDGGLSVGVGSEGDALPALGYKGRAGVGLSFAFDDGLRFDIDVHGGITSVALIPTPRVGLGLELAKRWELAAGFAVDVEGHSDLDVLIVLPAPSASLEGGIAWRAGPFETRLRAGVDSDALVLLVVNSISASTYLALSAGLALPP
jgi:hypothetical protein